MSYIRDASSSDAAAVQVLFASRRFPILHEAVESFIRDYLETDSVETSFDAIQSRALVVFSLMTVTVLSNSQFGPDFECLDFLERCFASH